MFRWDLITWSLIRRKIFQIFTLRLLVPYTYLSFAISIWSNSTYCYTRLFLIDFILLHLICIHPHVITQFESITVILFFLWVVESRNYSVDANCLNTHGDIFLIATFFFFKINLWASTLSLGIIIIILSGSIIREFFKRAFAQEQGVSQEVMNALPLLQYKDYNIENQELQKKFQSNESKFYENRIQIHEVCAICLEKFSDQDEVAIMPKCKHAFHYSCIKSWILSNNICPYCRRGIFEDTNKTDSQSQEVEMTTFQNNSTRDENLENLRNVVFYINP